MGLLSEAEKTDDNALRATLDRFTLEMRESNGLGSDIESENESEIGSDYDSEDGYQLVSYRCP